MTQALYGAFMLTMTALYFANAPHARYLWTAIGCASVLAILAGTLVNRPRQRGNL